MPGFFQRLRPVLFLATPLLVIDQLTKVWARQWLRFEPEIPLFGGHLTLVYAENPGAFLSLGAELSETARFLLFTVGVVALIGVSIWYLMSQSMDRLSTIGIGLFLAGGIGNLIDRVSFGFVIDFLLLQGFGLKTGVFNIADMAIMGGAACLIFSRGPSKTASDA
jgi:signal peptidase II